MIILPVEKRFDWSNPPYILALLVVFNVLIFTLYQSGDDTKLETAVEQYIKLEYFELEWPQYQAYLKQQEREAELDELEPLYQLYQEQGSYELPYVMLSDKGFYPYLIEHLDQLFDRRAYDYGWRDNRAKLHQAINSVSYQRFGLVLDDLSWYGFVTHQFMHGGTMHLVGNMVFLIICGFAVEAAIGHALFLGLYLLSGIAGAALFAFVDQGSGTLVGASGAISGVMAMYLWVFGLKQIKFFYWFYFLVGYIRLPALLILPLYIGRELYAFYFDTGSNVAFMAHAGGFIAASIAMALLVFLRPKVLDQEYIEQDQETDPYQKKLAEIYSAIEELQFKQVQRLVAELKLEEGESFELLMLEYNAAKVFDADKAAELAVQLLLFAKPTQQELWQQKQLWLENTQLSDAFSAVQLTKLGMRFVASDSIQIAESIFQNLDLAQALEHDVGIFARKLAVFYQRANESQKARYYSEIADSHLVAV